MNTIIEKIKKDKIINQIKTHSKDVEIYLVGGVFRDFYLGRQNFDKDIVVDKIHAKDFAKSLAKSLEATFVPLDEENKIYRVVLKDKINYIDIANIIGKSIKEDLKRRDLTINSVAINLKTLEIIDVTGGIKDLENKKIKHISEQNFIDDPLRLLRAYRFGAILGFKIDDGLQKIIKKHSKKVKQSAIERINYELLRLFEGSFSSEILFKMDKSEILEEILPMIKDLKKVPPNLHHHLNLFDHSIETVKQIQKLYEESSDEVKSHLKKHDFGGASRLAHLKFAGFLHDIGKFQTWTIDEETKRHRFIKHDDLGSKMAADFLKKSKFSKKQIEYISKMIKLHIYPSHVIKNPEINEKLYMRFIRKMKDDVIDIIILAMADRYSARGIEITDEIVNKNISDLNLLLEFYLKIKDELKPLPKLLSGDEIMEILNIKPSKELGEIIKKLHETQLSDEIQTKEEAVKFVKRLRN